ncbi:MAG: hypothetical protein ACLGI9_21585 [Thermoanaerobaculia bacterium]
MKHPTSLRRPSPPHLLLLALASWTLAPLAASAQDCPVLDSLQGISTEARFSVFGSSGTVISPRQLPGPLFTLAETTTITEIGAFLNNCARIIEGVPFCPDTSPFVVQIRPAVAGLPDPDVVLSTFVLSHDGEPLVISYESAQVGLTLEPGDYYALFAPAPDDPDDVGFVLSRAKHPFSFQSGDLTIGYLDPITGATIISSPQSAAVRILGLCSLEVALDIKPLGFPNAINPRSRGVIPVAVLSTAGFDATRIDPASLAFGPAGAGPEHARLTDVNADGQTDLLLHFRTQETGITCSTTSAALRGRTRDGQAIEGTDSVRTVGCK